MNSIMNSPNILVVDQSPNYSLNKSNSTFVFPQVSDSIKENKSCEKMIFQPLSEVDKRIKELKNQLKLISISFGNRHGGFNAPRLQLS